MTQRIPWSIVYGYFISSEEISLRACSVKYGLNYDTLRQKSSREGWAWKKKQIFKNALVLMDNRTAKEIAERNQAQVDLARILLLKAAQGLKAGIIPQSPKELREWISTGIMIERIALGLKSLDNQQRNINNQKWDIYEF